jgi:hypothetical protein
MTFYGVSRYNTVSKCSFEDDLCLLTNRLFLTVIMLFKYPCIHDHESLTMADTF